MMMSWEQDAKLWTDTGRVSPDTGLGMALALAYYEGKDISVVSSRGSRDIEVARLPQDDMWQIGKAYLTTKYPAQTCHSLFLGSFPRPLKGNVTNETANQLKFDDTSSSDFSLPF